MLLAGMVAGMAWAAIPAFLRARMNTNEILVTLMLTYIATLFLSWLVHGPWRDPAGFNYPQTALLPAAAHVRAIRLCLPGQLLDLHHRRRRRRRCGSSPTAASSATRCRSSGAAPLAARYAGFREFAAVWIGLLAGGAAAGIAGMAEAAGPLGQLSPQISPGYGFAAIIVAFIGRLNAFGIVLGGLLMSLLFLGGEAVQMTLGLPSALTRIFQGILLFFLLAADFFIFYRVRRIREAALMDLFIAIFTGTIIAATPLIFAALGELVVEKSGVLNLGIEGMMLMGAALAFGAVVAGLPMPVAILAGALGGGGRLVAAVRRAGAHLPDQPVCRRPGAGDLRLRRLGVDRPRLRQRADRRAGTASHSRSCPTSR